MIKGIRIISSKAFKASLIFLIFIYITVFLCTIPGNFTIRFNEGRLVSTHEGASIIRETNDKFASLLRLDFGTTRTDGRSLNFLFSKTMKNSLSLLTGGLIIAVILGLPKGIFDSKRGNDRGSGLKVIGTIIPVSIPDIMIIALLQRLAVYLNKNGIEIFRVGGGGSLNHMLLPLVALSILPASYIARITSMAIDECYKKDFIIVAIGKGASRTRVLWKHVMKNALPSIIGSLPSITSIIIGNLLMVERVFGYPGLTNALADFFQKYERDGLILTIILIGSIYFILDIIFYLLKWLVTLNLKERTI